MSASPETGAVAWPDEVDEVLGGDLTVGIGTPTPRGGVALATVTTLGLHDREAGTVGFTTSLGFGRKLERIADDPRIAVAYHTRQHGRSTRQGFALVQGRASIHAPTDEERVDVEQRAARFLGQIASGWFWDRWLRVYYQDRVIVEVTAQRVLWWPGDLRAAPEVYGAPLPTDPPGPQDPPRDAATARVPVAKVLRSARTLPHQLVGVLQADGLPLVLPTRVSGSSGDALRLTVDPPLLPGGARRAGFLAHDFRAGLIGLANATHTGWLEVDDAQRARWTPHTRHAFAAPPNKTLLLLGNGFMARRGYKRAIADGRERVLRHAGRTLGS